MEWASLRRCLWIACKVVFACLVCLFSLAPVIVVFGAAFTSKGYFSFPPRGLSLTWLHAAVSNEAFIGSLENSVKVALLVTLFACCLAYFGARSVLDHRSRVSGAVSLVLESPLMIPGIIIGFAGGVFYPTLGLSNSYYMTVFGLTVFTLPFAMRSIAANLASLSPSHPEAAATLGAGQLRTWWSVILPQLRPGLMSAAVFAFVLAFDNVTISLWMISPGFDLVPLWLLSYMENSSSPLPAAAGAIAAAINLCCFFALMKLGGVEAIVGSSEV